MIERHLDQFGFWWNMEVGKQFWHWKLLWKTNQKKGKTSIAFVDVEKSSDNVEWPKMFEILKSLAINCNKRTMIKNETAMVKVQTAKEEVKIQKGSDRGRICLHTHLQCVWSNNYTEVKHKVEN